MSFVKNHKPIETFTYSNGAVKTTYRKKHDKDCHALCACCAGDHDCSCGAVVWTFCTMRGEP